MASLAVGDVVKVRDKMNAKTILGLDPETIYSVEAVEIIRDDDGTDIPVLRLKGVPSPINSVYFDRI